MLRERSAAPNLREAKKPVSSSLL